MVGILGLGYVISEFAKRFSGAARSMNSSLTPSQEDGIFGPGVLPGYAFLVGDSDGFWQHAVPFCRRSSIKTSVVDLRHRAHRHRDRNQRVGYHVLSARAVDDRRAFDHPFIILSIVVIYKVVSGNHFSVFEPNHIARRSVFKGLLFAILMFVGFELAAVLGEETAKPSVRFPSPSSR